MNSMSLISLRKSTNSPMESAEMRTKSSIGYRIQKAEEAVSSYIMPEKILTIFISLASRESIDSQIWLMNLIGGQQLAYA